LEKLALASAAPVALLFFTKFSFVLNGLK
jgi:hypothetical protein